MKDIVKLQKFKETVERPLYTLYIIEVNEIRHDFHCKARIQETRTYAVLIIQIKSLIINTGCLQVLKSNKSVVLFKEVKTSLRTVDIHVGFMEALCLYVERENIISKF